MEDLEKDLQNLDRVKKSKSLSDSQQEKTENYQGSHRPPNKEYGAPLYDLTKIYPADVYDNMMDYASDFSQKSAALKIEKYRNKPQEKVEVFRAVPKGVKFINPRDWVAITKNYAITHSNHPTDKNLDLSVISAEVQAKDLVTDGNSFEEWGYVGETPVEGKIIKF